MELRELGARKRNLDFDQSIKNPLYLQTNIAVKTVREFFESIPGNGLHIYDFGCGEKPYEIFTGLNEYIGLDIDKKNQKADIFCSIDQAPVNDCSADVTCSFYVLEHVYKPIDVLKEKFRILKNGGTLFMLVPLYWEEHEQPYDFWRFTQFSLETMLNEVGFIDIEVKPISANWSIFGLHMVRLMNSRKITRALVPIFNKLFYRLDQKSLKSYKMHSNVMSYSVKASKGIS